MTQDVDQAERKRMKKERNVLLFIFISCFLIAGSLVYAAAKAFGS
ncbi:hypothetical protein [Kroppenstedtia pulmonis]|nr:hypothetical protein [Kroppenstedtia pulmonis]